MSNFLLDIVEKTQADIQSLYKEFGLEHFQKAALAISDQPSSKLSFFDSLNTGKLSLIAEVKKASPSKGIIRAHFEPVEIAQAFQSQGASAVSVLTEPHYFLGSPEILRQVAKECALPALRKDFIIDPIQIYQAKALGASCILLIKALLSLSECEELMAAARACEMDVLMEVHSMQELMEIISLEGIRIIGINNRDLTTFMTNIDHAPLLLDKIRILKGDDCLVVAESGYTRLSELALLEKQGFDAVLIGEGLAKYPELLSYFSVSP